MTAPVTAPTSSVKSNIITNLDATPPVRWGLNGGGRLVRLVSTIKPSASQATSVLSRLVRIPSNCLVHKVAIILDAAATTLTGDVGLWYSDAYDGTASLNVGNLTAISSAFFAYELAMATFAYVPGTDPANVVGLSSPVDITFSAATLALTDGNYVPSLMSVPIWQAVATQLAAITTPVGAFTNTSQAPHFMTASAGGSVYVRSDDPGGFFDIGLQLTSAGSAANVNVTTLVDIVVGG